MATTATVLYFILTTTRLHWTGSLKFFVLNRFRWIRVAGGSPPLKALLKMPIFRVSDGRAW